MTDESVIEWARGWLQQNTPDDPTFRQRFLESLASELKQRRDALVSVSGLLNELWQVVLASPTSDASCIAIAQHARDRLTPVS